MDIGEIERKAKNVILEQLGLDNTEEINRNNLFVDLGADSLDSVEIINNLEEEFDIKISDKEAQSAVDFTIGEIIEYIDKKLKEKQNSPL